jgi:hypothetical protein
MSVKNNFNVQHKNQHNGDANKEQATIRQR